MTELNALLQPGKIGKLSLRNRLVMAAMGGVSPREERGAGNQRALDFYVERAKGVVGLIITPSVVSTEANMPGVAPDATLVSRIKGLAKALHQHGAKLAVQTGYVTLVSWPGVQQVGPSPVPSFTNQVTPRALTIAEIETIVEAWGEAARRIQSAGADAVEIQAAHGYFLSAFLSPFRNRRTDQYGGSLENRARFTREVIQRVREKVGTDFPILIRMNGSDYLEGGLTNDEAVLLARMFVAAGVDAIDVSVATQDSRQWRDLSYLYPDGAIVHLAAAIKKAVSVPVIAVGKIGNVALANQIISEGKADFVAMGRGLLAEPALLSKTSEGRTNEIHGCIYCNNCRTERTAPDGTRKRGISCTVNPALGREREFQITPAPSSKKVMVIGGGLAGMEAAIISAQRGHQVSLYEKSGELGGQWNIASMPADKAHFCTLSQYLIREMGKAGVKVILNSEVSRKLTETEKPDAVVIATGAVSIGLDVPGAQGDNVVQAVDVIGEKVKVGSRVVVIGGRLRAMEVADLLAQQGKRVTLVTRGRLGGSGEPLERNMFVTLREHLVERGVAIFPFAPVFEIKPNGVYVVLDKELLFLPADTVVLAVGAKPVNGLVTELNGVVRELYAIGDCARVRDGREAVNEGAEIALKI